MKRLVFIVVVIALVVGCACKQQVPCPPYPVALTENFECPEDRVLCYVPFDFQYDGRYHKQFVTHCCPPGCVDKDLVLIPGCKAD
jgi:hypothetical protein